MPQTLAQAVFEARIADLEAFWDSEMHRAVEHSAIGWASWEANGRPTQIEPTSSRRNVTPTPPSDPYGAWAASEILNDRAHPIPHAQPTRTTTAPIPTLQCSYATFNRSSCLRARSAPNRSSGSSGCLPWACTFQTLLHRSRTAGKGIWATGGPARVSFLRRSSLQIPAMRAGALQRSRRTAC